MTKLELAIAVLSENGKRVLTGGQKNYAKYISEKTSKKELSLRYNLMLQRNA